MVRTRTAAAALAASGHVRLNGERVAAASRPVKIGDVVTVALDRSVRVMKVSGFAERRGGAGTAGNLYEDLQPKAPPATDERRREASVASAAQRDPGAGRPTKRERRALDRLTGFDGDKDRS